MTRTERTLNGMQVGECRWVGHVSIHVYCHGTRDGDAYTAKAKSFKVVTDEEGYDEQEWVTAEEASSIVDAEASELGV